jgi:GNAT superfamily N-acetyltransferase
MDGLLIRGLAVDDIPGALALCREAGWNQTADDWRLFLHLAPETCRAACIDGRLVGTVTVLPYGPFAWIGMVLVERRSRGRGIGTALLHEALRLVDPGSSGRLDATPLGRPLYEKLGFQADFDLSRMQCDSFRDPADANASWNDSSVVRPLKADDLVQVARWDARVFGADRVRLLSHCLENAPHLAWIVESNRLPAGYLLGRRGHDFDHLGPLVANSPSVATLLTTMALRHVNRSAVIDVPVERQTFREWLVSCGFLVQRPLTRMTRGSPTREFCPHALFATLGPEFG